MGFPLLMPWLKNYQCASKEPLIYRTACRARCFLFSGRDSPWELDQPCIWGHLTEPWASLVVQTVKNLPALGETWVQSLDQEDPLEKGMATHSGILAWRICMVGYSPWGCKQLDTTEWLSLFLQSRSIRWYCQKCIHGCENPFHGERTVSNFTSRMPLSCSSMSKYINI